MKADLPVREPEMLKRWAEEGLYEKIQQKGQGKPVFLLHDGPPYANGVIHIGHALNKILKDFVIKYKTLAGYQSPYIPGWDCHGLPIEHQLFKTLGKSKHQVSRNELRDKARDYALGFVEEQRKDFKRLGVLGEWDKPYLTLSNDYEAGIVKTFFELKEAGYVYKGLKPGYWCAFDETALAEAEVEYADKKSDSVFVRFKLQNNTYVLIWTTTPWTLPANKALAFHPDEKYVLIKKGGDSYVVAQKLRDAVAKKVGADVVADSPIWTGKDFEGKKAKHPFTGGESLVVTAGYVTMEDGTGIVHIAPGHGVEDFAVGQRYNLEVFSPVNERGLLNEEARPAELQGKHVLKDANAAVMDVLARQNDLIFHQPITHSYPHCWRCKNPIIFRATEQWFLGVSDEFRKKLLASIDTVQWEPSYGVHRIRGMVEQRPDWCLSRQRHWGAPIAVFYCANKSCGDVLWDKKLNEKLVELISKDGANVYYDKSEADLFKSLGVSPQCQKCKGGSFRKEMDILDVWFDSGVSWSVVVKDRLGKYKPEHIMYLEGSDQHRGWFQTSLIPSVALLGRPPFNTVLTHGFVVDGKGHKMSKSTGNTVAPQSVIQQYGADVLRLWVAMSDYREDVRVSTDIIKHMVDVYRRFRNTFRFLLQNTADFKFKTDAVALDKLEEVDRWVLSHFETVKANVRKAYDAYEFHVVLGELNRFVSVELSGFYLDALKDRLYCEEANSPLRRSAQTAFFHIARGLATLLAPLLSFTAEEAYLELRKVSAPDLPDSVFLDSFKTLANVTPNADLNKKWDEILKLRGKVNNELDAKKKEGVIGSSQQAAVKLSVPSEFKDVDWPFVLQVAQVEPQAEDAIQVSATSFGKCDRCWRYRQDVGQHPDHPTLCGRCKKAVSEKSAVAS